MVKKMLEVVVNYLYPALTTVKTDWLFLCTADSVMFPPALSVPSSAQSPFPPAGLLYCETSRQQGQPWTHLEAVRNWVPSIGRPGSHVRVSGPG